VRGATSDGRPYRDSNPDWDMRIDSDNSACRKFQQKEVRLSTNEVVHACQPLGQAFMNHGNLRQVIRPENYGKPAVLVFHSAERSGCGSVLAPFGTSMGRGAAVQRDEGRALSTPRSPSSERSGATIPRASTSVLTFDNSISFSLRSS
jgi:hypothetical protein